ncbi:MAG: RagB/SusD family nutrient uptake outer membrane protein [Chitinophagaceae bacterium]
MKFSKYYITVIVVATLALQACKKNALDTDPTDRLIDSYFWASPNDAQYAVNAIYNQLPAIDYLYFDGASDNAFNQKTFERAYPFGNGTQDPATTAWSSDFWANAYKGIQRVNYFLENVDRTPNLSETLKKQYIGEARFLRAFFYNDLINLYGDVPLVTSTLNTSNGSVKRDDKQKVFDFIISELNEISTGYVLNAYTGTSIGRVTTGAVLALKARAYLWQNKYAEAKAAAKAVIDLNRYSLYGDYAGLFKYVAENNSEVIFDKQYLATTNSNNLSRLLSPRSSQGDGSLVPIRSLVDAYECTDGKTIAESPLYDPNNPYENRDPRLKASIITPGSTWNGILFNPTPGSGTPDMIASNVNASITGFNFKKYVNLEDLAQNNNNGGINIILLRYADVLLTYAESGIETNTVDNSVYDALNKVRRRAGIPAIAEGSKTMAQLKAIIRNERRVELSLEGTRVFDIRRWKTAEIVMNQPALGMSYLKDGAMITVKAEDRKFNPARDYLWPIPQREIFVNKLLVQNPNY